MTFCSEYGAQILSTCYLGDWDFIGRALIRATVVGLALGIGLYLIKR